MSTGVRPRNEAFLNIFTMKSNQEKPAKLSHLVTLEVRECVCEWEGELLFKELLLSSELLIRHTIAHGRLPRVHSPSHALRDADGAVGRVNLRVHATVISSRKRNTEEEVKGEYRRQRWLSRPCGTTASFSPSSQSPTSCALVRLERERVRVWCEWEEW